MNQLREVALLALGCSAGMLLSIIVAQGDSGQLPMTVWHTGEVSGGKPSGRLQMAVDAQMVNETIRATIYITNNSRKDELIPYVHVTTIDFYARTWSKDSRKYLPVRLKRSDARIFHGDLSKEEMIELPPGASFRATFLIQLISKAARPIQIQSILSHPHVLKEPDSEPRVWELASTWTAVR